MIDLMRHVRALADEIGPRGSTGPGEAAAAIYIESVMRRFTPQVWAEPFRSFSSFSWPYGLLLLGGLLGGALIWWAPAWGALLAAVVALFYLLQTLGAVELGLLFRKRASRNVIGVVAPSGPVRHRIVLMAHYDSAKTAINFSPSQVPYFRLTFLLITGAILALPLLGVLALAVGDAPWIRWAVILATAYLAVAFLTVVDREVRGKYTPGANDNGSGVATMLGLCEELSGNPLRHTEVWCVATGCEEVGMMGARAFLDRHGHMLRDAHFIILDNHGKGEVRYTEGEGMLRVLPSDPGLVKLAREVARRHPAWKVGPARQVLMPTDAAPALRRGFRAIALLAYDQRGFLPNWHWHTDTSDNVDPACLAVVVKLVGEMARTLDRQATETGAV